MPFDHYLATALLFLGLWLVLSGLDDLFLSLVFLWRHLRWVAGRGSRLAWPSDAVLALAPARRIAIFVPLWQEHGVIRQMLEHNLAAVRYPRYDVFIGVYPNDQATRAAVEAARASRPHVHVAMCPHDGPTSKADCLNWIYQHMLLYEQEQGAQFDIVVTHDAEDVIHPESLRLINYFARHYDMVQVPVLALPTPFHELTHGLYCDEFAEYQSKDIPVRQILGGFLPSNGVGTGYTRAVLEKLALEYSNRLFEPACLTEDYENGYRIHRLRCRQIFLPLRRIGDSLVATREYFPQDLGAALRQRTRWTMGIALQGWERHGWRVPLRQLYWFWRDRKGLVGNLVSPLANLCSVYGVLEWRPLVAQSPALAWLFPLTLALAMYQLAIRAWCAGRVYGWRFALGVPLRVVWGNWLNAAATLRALAGYFGARLRNEPLVWVKTDHVYPNLAALAR